MKMIKTVNVDMETDCKKASTAIRRFFRANPELEAEWKETIEWMASESIENYTDAANNEDWCYSLWFYADEEAGTYYIAVIVREPETASEAPKTASEYDNTTTETATTPEAKNAAKTQNERNDADDECAQKHAHTVNSPQTTQNAPQSAPTAELEESVAQIQKALKSQNKGEKQKVKNQTTKNNVMNTFEHVVSAPYCALQHVFAGVEPVAYTAGKYGWNADIYDMGGGLAIVTGYRPFGEKIERDFFATWDNAARDVITAGGSLAEVVRDMVGTLLAMLAPPDATTVARIAATVAIAEEMKNAYFFAPPKSAAARRSYEKRRTCPEIEWREGGHSYSAALDVSCSCAHVYASGKYYRDGVKTTLTAIKKSLERLEKEA